MTDWNVRLQFDGVEIPDPVDDTLDALFELLAPQVPVATVEPGRLSLYLTVGAPSPEPALRAARSVARESMKHSGITNHRNPIGVEIYTNEELDRLNREPNFPDVVGVAEAAAMLGVSKQRVSELARSKRFPRPLYELAAGPIWVKGAIEAFVEKWERKPGRPRKAAG
jgi:hypothetical protein